MKTKLGRQLPEAEVEAPTTPLVYGPCVEPLSGGEECGKDGHEVDLTFFGKRILCEEHRQGWAVDLATP